MGSDSGQCYDSGCGHSGWVQSSYTISEAGSYRLAVGTVNWSDTSYNSGLPLDRVTVNNVAVLSDVPKPSTMALAALGFVGVITGARRRAAAARRN